MRRLVLVAIAVAALSSPALAQRKGTTEFGLDGNLSVGLDDVRDILEDLDQALYAAGKKSTATPAREHGQQAVAGD